MASGTWPFPSTMKTVIKILVDILSDIFWRLSLLTGKMKSSAK